MFKAHYSLVRHDILDEAGNPTPIPLDKTVHEPANLLNLIEVNEHSDFIALVDYIIWTLRKYRTQEIIDGGFSLDMPINDEQRLYLGLVKDRVYILSDPYPYFAVEVGNDRGVRYFLKDEEKWLYYLMATHLWNSLEGKECDTSYGDFVDFLNSDERAKKTTLPLLASAADDGYVETPALYAPGIHFQNSYGEYGTGLSITSDSIPEWAVIRMHANPVLDKSWIPKMR